MGSANKNRIKTRIWKYLMDKGPMPIAGMREDLDWLGTPNEVSQMLDRSYLFEKVGTTKVGPSVISGINGTTAGGGYEVVVWGALPLEVATKKFMEPRKHQIRPLSKQPAFVRKYVEEKLDEQNK